MSPRTRREFLKDASLLGAGITALPEKNLFAAAFPQSPASAAPSVHEVTLSRLGEIPPATATGVSWGVPFPQGAIPHNSLCMLTAGNKQFPLQSWPLAYWPDGSIKWNGFATVVPAGFSGPATLSMNLAELQGPGLTPYSPVTVKNDGESLVVDTGAMQCSIPLSGAKILNSIGMGGKSIAGAAQLVCILQHGPSTDENAAPAREKFTSAIQHVTVEQPGGVRAVVKIEGMHRGAVSKREWMPFVVRLYFYSGQSEIRLVHSIVFDGDQEKDFVRGLGLEFDVP
ncbi:MAG: hypothetical protein WCC73_00780, partial [Terracidiphilus sp.]